MRDNEKKRQYLTHVTEKINHKQAKNEIVFELDAHIDERAQFYEEIGYTEEEAFEKAVEQMGDPERVGVSLSRLHPKGIVWKILFSLLSLLWICALIFLFGFMLWFVKLGDGKVSGGWVEAIPLLSFLGLSQVAKKRDCIFLSVILPILFSVIYGLYTLFICTTNGFSSLFSPLIFNFFCLITGDFKCITLLPYVGGVTVAPWLRWTSIIFYVLIYFLLISVSVSTIKLHRPPYSLFTKQAGNAVTAVEKPLCAMMMFTVLVSWIPFETPSERTYFFEGPSFDSVYVLQSDTPCAIEDVKEEDVWCFGPRYDWGSSIYWYGEGSSDSRKSREIESLTIPCGNKMCYRVDKHIFTCYVNKPYVSVYFVDKDYGDLRTFSEILPEDLDWQRSETVGTVSRVYDAYNCVEVTIHTGE